jgi:hypothetical protein
MMLARRSKDNLNRAIVRKMVTGTESLLDITVLPAALVWLRSFKPLAEITDWVVAGVIATFRFIMHDYGEEENIFFIILTFYSIALAVALVGLFG